MSKKTADTATGSATAPAAAPAASPLRYAAETLIDASTDLEAFVGAMFPGEKLIAVRARLRDPKRPDRVFVESYQPTGEIQNVFGIPMRVGEYLADDDNPGKVLGGTAPLTGWIPESLWNDRRYERVE